MNHIMTFSLEEVATQFTYLEWLKEEMGGPQYRQDGHGMPLSAYWAHNLDGELVLVVHRDEEGQPSEFPAIATHSR